MKISIAEKFCLFSHTPGASCLVPGALWTLQAFPTKLCFSYQDQRIDVALQLTGPVKQFTLEQDLEKRAVRVLGEAKEGYFRLRIAAENEGFLVHAEKTPAEGLITSRGRLLTKESFLIPVDMAFCKPSRMERLSLGSHKKQDWDDVRRRLDLREILPPLLYLAQHVPKLETKSSLFPEEKTKAVSLLASFFQAHCTQMLVPRAIDDQHQGIYFPQMKETVEPSSLLHEAASWARSLFIATTETQVTIFPYLPSEFASGRFLQVSLGNFGFLDMEWASSCLRKMVITAAKDGEIPFAWPKNVRSFRIRTNRFEKGRYQKTTEPFMVKATATYFLDHFQS